MTKSIDLLGIILLELEETHCTDVTLSVRIESLIWGTIEVSSGSEKLLVETTQISESVFKEKVWGAGGEGVEEKCK